MVYLLVVYGTVEYGIVKLQYCKVYLMFVNCAGLSPAAEKTAGKRFWACCSQWLRGHRPLSSERGEGNLKIAQAD
jgi:hypothetical protein